MNIIFYALHAIKATFFWNELSGYTLVQENPPAKKRLSIRALTASRYHRTCYKLRQAYGDLQQTVVQQSFRNSASSFLFGASYTYALLYLQSNLSSADAGQVDYFLSLICATSRSFLIWRRQLPTPFQVLLPPNWASALSQVQDSHITHFKGIVLQLIDVLQYLKHLPNGTFQLSYCPSSHLTLVSSKLLMVVEETIESLNPRCCPKRLLPSSFRWLHTANTTLTIAWMPNLTAWHLHNASICGGQLLTNKSFIRVERAHCSR